MAAGDGDNAARNTGPNPGPRDGPQDKTLPDFSLARAPAAGVAAFDPAALALDLIDEAPMALDVGDEPPGPPLRRRFGLGDDASSEAAFALNEVSADAVAKPSTETGPAGTTAAVFAAFASRRALDQGPAAAEMMAPEVLQAEEPVAAAPAPEVPLAEVDPPKAKVPADFAMAAALARARKAPAVGPAPAQRASVPRPALAKPMSGQAATARNALPFPGRSPLSRFSPAKGKTGSAAAGSGTGAGAGAGAGAAGSRRDRNVVPLAKPESRATAGAGDTAAQSGAMAAAKGMTGLDGRPLQARGRPRFLGLILTGLLLAALAVVAGWSSFYLSSNEADPGAAPAETAVAGAAPANDAAANDAVASDAVASDLFESGPATPDAGSGDAALALEALPTPEEEALADGEDLASATRPGDVTGDVAEDASPVAAVPEATGSAIAPDAEVVAKAPAAEIAAPAPEAARVAATTEAFGASANTGATAAGDGPAVAAAAPDAALPLAEADTAVGAAAHPGSAQVSAAPQATAGPLAPGAAAVPPTPETATAVVEPDVTDDLAARQIAATEPVTPVASGEPAGDALAVTAGLVPPAAGVKPDAAPLTGVVTDAVQAGTTASDPQDEIFLAGADTPPQTSDPLVLPQVQAGSDPPPEIGAPPLPFGTAYSFDAEGRIQPTPEGIITPEGVLLVAGAPRIVPPTRPIPAQPASLAPGDAGPLAEPGTGLLAGAAAPLIALGAPTGPEAGAEALVPDPALAGKKPKSRPAGLVDPATTDQQGEVLAPAADSRFAGLRPQRRLDRLSEDAASQAALDQTPVVNEAAAASLALNGVRGSASAQAVAVSRKPAARPSGMDQAVDAAVAAAVSAADPGTEAAQQTASLAPEEEGEPETEGSAPPVPTNASVAKQATVKDALNLSRLALIGIFGSASGRYALVRQSGGGVKKIAVGDTIDGGRVAAISATEVQYQKGGRMVTLSLPRG